MNKAACASGGSAPALVATRCAARGNRRNVAYRLWCGICYGELGGNVDRKHQCDKCSHEKNP